MAEWTKEERERAMRQVQEIIVGKPISWEMTDVDMLLDGAAAIDLQCRLNAAVDALEGCAEALRLCYNVTDYPANGQSMQDGALDSARVALARAKGTL